MKPRWILPSSVRIEGNELLYSFCQQCNIAHKNWANLLWAVKKRLPPWASKTVWKYFFSGKEEFHKKEPCLQADEALFVPSTAA